MGRFMARRLAFFLVTLWMTSVMIFLLVRVLPGDVARVILGRDASETQVEAKREELGLNDPLFVQYFTWITDFVRGDWGESFAFRGQDIRELVTQRLVNSARLGLISMLIAIPVSITLGVIAGLTEGKLPDNLISVFSLSVVSLPEFVTGLFLINTVALKWADNPIAEKIGWFPSSSAVRADASFRDALPSLWLPAIAATLVLLAYIARLTRAGVIEEKKSEYVRTAVLKGLPYPVVIFKHILRNALLPTVTVIAISTGWLISGLVVIEFVFGYPGLGSLLITAIERRDLPMIQAVVMVTVSVILIANFVADLLYAALNPRITLN
ncbi:MAG: ABC transporter permease [Anaerolineae bacterium]|jgi:peptide/nickel transport system permease protein|nr:MAG: ABC transporter permease [Anaerolineae bacterium]MCL4879594.1 ABC transporter permease [Anaerolineae bacterium]